MKKEPITRENVNQKIIDALKKSRKWLSLETEK